jgi:hypothetical protein
LLSTPFVVYSLFYICPNLFSCLSHFTQNLNLVIINNKVNGGEKTAATLSSGSRDDDDVGEIRFSLNDVYDKETEKRCVFSHFLVSTRDATRDHHRHCHPHYVTCMDGQQGEPPIECL